MGATSVTGVSGSGSVAGQQKGSEEMSLGVKKLVGVRVAAAGTTTLSGGAATVSFPAVGTDANDFIAIATDTTAAAAIGVTALTTTSLTLAGTGSHVINWVVVKIH